VVQSEVLFKIIEALEVLEIPYMIVGSFASNYWGRPRMTHDGDVVVEIPAHKVNDLAEWLAVEFYAPDFVIREAIHQGDHFNALHLQSVFKIDFWMRQRTPYDQMRFQRRVHGLLLDRKVWMTSPEDVILSKLLWYKASPVLERQLQDVLEVYEIQEPDLDQAYLNRWAAQLGVDHLLAQIRTQVARPPDDKIAPS
jgi:hypothetical protein